MVGMNKEAIAREISEEKIIDLPQEELNWGSVSLSEVLNSDTRLEASVYNIEGRHAREIFKKCKWELASLCGDKGLASAYHRPRFKRIWVEKSPFPIYQPSQILEIYPKPSGYISEATKTDIEALKVKKGQILLTCSGTIGNCSVVSKTLENKIFSHDLIRIDCKNEIDIGYVYAFLKTKTGRTLINTNNYGAVVSHIEPEHLHNIPIPNPPNMLKKRIHELVMKSYDLRDESNELLDKAEGLLVNELELPPVDAFNLVNFNNVNVNNFSVKLSDLAGRLDASYHLPIVKTIIEHFKIFASEVVTLEDNRLINSIFLPGRFKRVYVGKGQGTVFFGGKQIQNLDPSIENKYLSTKYHSSRIKNELLLKEGEILVSRSGTIGKVALVPKHWEGWAASEDLIRIVPLNEQIGGFLYVFLSSQYGQILLKRFTYGSVQDHIEDIHLAKVEVPLLKCVEVQDEISYLAIKANKLRYEAYRLEQQVLTIVNDEVINKT
ncbi:MAG: restriction endonuclease subunit S [Peptococcaceae bacterium]|nr:restriction endonuclease subunit S [Peptococcaceae bacterium]